MPRRLRPTPGSAPIIRLIKGDRYKDRKEIPEAYDLLGKAYRSEKKFPEALAAWREYLARFPSQEAWIAVQNEIVETEDQLGVEREQRPWKNTAS
ncbi:MAG: tetratricopeptide repeat protein [Thermoguttaceae bacterium]